jgi:hypothetical protein
MLWSLAALVPLAAIYLLKVRPRRRPTTALFLWKQIVQERRPHHLLHRLRDLWSLLLVGLAFAAVAFALAEPRWDTADRQDLLLLIDTSASMAAPDGGSTRLARAQERVRSVARAMDGVQRVAVATIDQELRFLSHLTDNPREILAAMDRVKVTSHTLNLRALPREPEASREDKGGDKESKNGNATRHRLLLVSDGGFDAAALPPHVELVRVGEQRENVGIVAADLDFVPGQKGQLRFFFQLASAGSEPRELDLLLTHVDGEVSELKKVIPVSVRPGVNEPQVLTIEGAQPGRWVAKLDHQDSLEADDTAYLVARRPPPIDISVVAEDRFFLENSVLAFSQEADMLRLVSEGQEVVLAQGAAPDADRVIVLGPNGESAWWTELGDEVEISAPRVLVEDHPALKHIDAATIQFLGARQITPPPGAQVLVDSPEGVPLVYLASRDGKRAVVVNMNPIEAEFYFSAWFPVLVYSASTHLVGREEPLLSVYPTDTVVQLPVEEQITSRVTSPMGVEREVQGKYFGDLAELGFYEAEMGEARETIASSLLAVEETLLVRDGDVIAEVAPLQGGLPPAYWLTAAAIVLLTTESVLYYRRKVG